MNTTTLTTADGLTLHLRHWPAPSPRGTVLIVHGLGEHIGRYGHVAEHLNRLGWHVAGHDHRGHGQSEGAKGRLGDGDDLVRDLAAVIDSVRGQRPGPLVLLGHSLGGLVAARFIAEGLAPSPAAWHRPVDALVLSSPALDPGMNAVQKMMLAVAGPLAPDLAVGNGLRPEWISRDPAVVQAYASDPLVHGRVTPRLVRFIVDGGRLVLQEAPRWKVPTLLLYAGSDRCVAPRGSAAFAAAAPGAVVTAREFPALFHEILNEPERHEVFAALDAWLAQRQS
ncbi:alpha/beta hydrolase [Piscinibacter sp. XHJ-5]|uniref:alpha/beta hydrolase n=1 Tax=Piscinibacter sp. XHJ-5 TaxID=3037797 RepID=UPI0024530F28|nr:alpha/beta hydrolase [Piscinibacter sp. XHJ-5]